LVHMARNPAPSGRKADLHWHSYYVYDVQNGWFRYFDHAPRNEDVYGRMTWFKFETEEGWEVYASRVMMDAWESSLAARPAKKFSNPTVQRTGASRSAQETNRTPSADGSRR